MNSSDEFSSDHRRPSAVSPSSPSPRSGVDAASSAAVFIVFGELRGWEQRQILRFRTGHEGRLPLDLDADFATVHVGPESIRGPVVYDDVVDETRCVVVFGGRRFPGWLHQREMAAFGWLPCDDLPPKTNVAMEEVDALVLTVDDDGRASGWTRTIWLPYVPRPLERISIPCGDGRGSASMPVRVLEIGDDLIIDGETVPFAVLSCDELPHASILQANGWCVEPWVAARIGAWTGLNGLSKKIESHVGVVLGFAMVTSVTLHDPNGIADSPALHLLPNDVRIALSMALEDEAPGSPL